ncbi:hypothetical protein [Paraburkholderia sp. SG-MS1]|nr:hypothetical protein [Paraburkholderia sp. SG-MS1]
MLIDTHDYAPKLKQAIGELGAAAPATLAGFQALDAFAQQSG